MDAQTQAHPGRTRRSKVEPIPGEVDVLSTDQENKTGAWFLHWVRRRFARQKPSS